MKDIKKMLILSLILSLSFTIVNAQETESIDSKYAEVLTVNPLTFNVDEIATFDLTDISLQAAIAMEEMDYKKAASFFLYAIKHNADDVVSLYSLAKCYAALGEELYAANFLIMAVNHGFNNFSQIRDEKVFQLLLNKPEFSESYEAILKAGEVLGENIYVKAEKLMKCRLFLPENYDASKSYPLLIGMHGFGGSTEGYTQLWSLLKTHSFIFVIPEGPYSAYPNSYIQYNSYSWDIKVPNLDLYKRSDHLSAEFIVNVKKQMAENYKIDKSYILGFSQGGAHAYAAGIKNPDEFEGIICFGAHMPNTQKHPWFLSDEDVENGNKLRVYIAHGKDDPYTYKNAVQAKRTLKKYKYEVEQYLFDGGHTIDLLAFIKALHWMGIQNNASF